uniref:Uncharacterized protein n=1 Tax=Vespula pensylvanica TaxID=30213 RepID=A0A834N0I3_VESPE|nr:hypothetical protein H0235_017676 [Vespula pensylvanica]
MVSLVCESSKDNEANGTGMLVITAIALPKSFPYEISPRWIAYALGRNRDILLNFVEVATAAAAAAEIAVAAVAAEVAVVVENLCLDPIATITTTNTTTTIAVAAAAAAAAAANDPVKLQKSLQAELNYMIFAFSN